MPSVPAADAENLKRGEAPLWALLRVLSPRRRAAVGVQLVMMALSAVSETITLGAVVPFLALVASGPTARFDVPLLALNMDMRAASLLFVAAALAGMGIRVVTQVHATHLAFGIGGDLGGEVYRRILHQPYAWHARRSSSEALASLAKVNSVVSGVLNPLLQGAVAMLAALGIIVALMLIDPVVALSAAAAVGLLYGVTMLFVRRRVLRNGRLVAEAEALRIRAIQEGLGGIRDVLLEGSQPHFHAAFDRHNRRSRRAQASNAILYATPRHCIETAGLILIVVLAGWLADGQQGISMAVPVLGALALGAQRLLPQLQAVYFAWSNFRGNSAQLGDVLELVKLPMPSTTSPVLPGPDVRPCEAATPLVRLEDVVFNYAGNEQIVLEGINLEIPCGSRVGIIGQTGCGKSTLVDIVMGLLSPTRGKVWIDGKLRDERHLAGWQRRIAHVPQQIFLADASIARNIAFGVQDDALDMARVRVAAQMAQLESFVAGLPEGFEATAGERGVRLSGGQRQRIGIARALYRQAELLVLDEATSALDDRTEADVIETIAGLGRDLTIVMIAHRLSTLQGCDLIAEIDSGRIRRIGTPDEILSRPVQLA